MHGPNERAQRGKPREAVPRRHEAGAAIAEFAVVAILVWVLLAGILDLGRAMIAQQVLQNAAGSAARELSLVELPPLARFEEGRDAIFDDGFLVADRDLLQRCGAGDDLTFSAVARAMEAGSAPSLNRLLIPLWIRDEVGGNEVLRYPGAVLQRAAPTGDCASGSQYTVRIPELDSDGSLTWRNVVEALPMDASNDDPFPFPTAWAAIRVQYPFQAAGLQAWQDGRMVEVTQPTAAAPDGLGWVDTQESGTYAGRYGLGVLHSMNRDVRPFRRVLSAGAAFRREIFAPGSTL